MKPTFKHAAVAVMAAVSFASAHAVSIDNVTDSFKLGKDISALLGSLATVSLQAQGTATFAAGTLSMPATSTTTSNSSATDLITFAQGAGLKISSGANVISLADLSFNNAAKSVNAVISLNGAATFTGTALTSTVSSTLTTPFLTGLGGELTSGPMKLSSGASLALATALGFSFLAPALQGYEFGTFTVVAPAIPEPSTYALVGAGLAVVALARKCKAA